MLKRLEKILGENCMLELEGPLLVGVSGGPDSLYLMDALHQLGYPIIVAHFDHSLRPDSASEALALKFETQRRGIPFVSARGAVQDFARQNSQSIEEAARNLRYRFLFDQAMQSQAQAVAVGHSADDQVETILMHLLRGAGLAGLRGMEYRRLPNPWSNQIPLVRPLLGFWREEIQDAVRQRELRPFFDESNTDRRYYRNRIRLELLPQLEQFSPGVRKRLLKTTEILAAEDEVLQAVVDQAWSQCAFDVQGDLVGFDRQAMLKQPTGVRRRLLRRAIERLIPGLYDLDFVTIEKADAFLFQPTRSGYTDLAAGLRIENLGSRTWLACWETPIPSGDWPQIEQGREFELTIPIDLDLNGGWRLQGTAQPARPELLEQAHLNQDAWRAWLNLDRLQQPIQMRARWPGDRFHPMGMGGHSLKLSDYMINTRIPRQYRSAWPLFLSAGEIVWVPGYAIADRFGIDSDTRQVLVVNLRKERRI